MITLVIGGTRSGKSEVGERLAAQHAGGAPVSVVVPAIAGDDDFAARIAEHRARRPDDWPTVECGASLVESVQELEGTVLVDSLGSWVATAGDRVSTSALVEALTKRAARTVVITEEVGLSVHAPTEVGRRFVDTLGALNTAVAAVAEEVVLVVAGRVVKLESLGH